MTFERPWGMLLSNVGFPYLVLEALEDPQEMHLLTHILLLE